MRLSVMNMIPVIPLETSSRCHPNSHSVYICGMAFPPGFLDELRARLSLSDVVGRKVRLKRRSGSEYAGLCPFHNEKTPSFTVNDKKGFYHCFGCGEHGDAVGFVMKTDGLSFPESVEKLAREVGLPVPRAPPAQGERAARVSTLPPGALNEAPRVHK